MHRLRHVVLTGCTVLATLTAGGCGGGEATKEPELLRGDGFTVNMPGKPKRTEQSVTSAVGPVKVIAYISDGKDLAYSVSYTEIPKGVEGDLAGAVQGAAANTGGTVRDDVKATHQGFPARDARITGVADDKGTSFTRVIIAKGRLYQLQVVQKGSNLDTPPDAYTTFRSSLKIG